MSDVPLIETERLHLRPLRTSDAGPISLFCGDVRVARMLESIPHPYPPGAAEAYIASTLDGRTGEEVFAIDASPISAAEFMGVIGYRPSTAEIGYWVGPPFWNTGYASEALNAVIGHLFAHGGVVRLVAKPFEDNAASTHLLEKLGFLETGSGEAYSVARAGLVKARHFALEASAWSSSAGVADAAE